MQNDQIYSELTSLIKTREDFNLIKNQLDALEVSLYELKTNNFESTLGNNVRADLAQLISKAIRTEGKEEVIKKMREALGNIKFVELTLSFEPPNKLLEIIYEWFNKNVSQNISLDVKVDPDIIGGALITFEGKFFDGSLKRRLQDILKNYV